MLYYITAKMTGGGKVGGKTSTASKAKYNAKAYDEIKAFAASRGLSLNEFITTAILEAMNRAGT